jgi:hypothetical protein
MLVVKSYMLIKYAESCDQVENFDEDFGLCRRLATNDFLFLSFFVENLHQESVWLLKWREICQICAGRPGFWDLSPILLKV